jgi:diguanylate cyclase (GGDEF)-like protein
MKKFYNENSDESLDSLRDKIIGLGENSIKKNYYPELQERLTELERINLRNKALLNGIPDAFLLLDKQGKIVEFHPASNNTFIIFSNNLKGKNINEVFPENVQMVFKSYLEQPHNPDEVVQFNFDLKHDRICNYYEVRAVKLYEDEFLFIIRDISEMYIMIEKLKYLGSRDYLTGLFNRTVFEEYMKNYETNEFTCIGIVICDVDGLKFINDTLGHKTGDFVLKKASKMIAKCFEEQDIVARIGGDEFAVLMHSINEQYLVNSCKKIEDEVSKFNIENDKLQIGLSVGYAYSTNNNSVSDALFLEADNVMYRKKLLKNTGIRSTIVKTLMKALEARDFITEGHAERLGNIAVKIAEEIGLSQTTIDDIKLLAKFHDIGKVGIPDNILFKPGRLSEDEMRVMQGHCEIGHRIANSAPELSHIANLILMHHEKWDGGGYTLRLKGLEIPIECRIIAIADAYDAMSNDRPYRKAMKKKDIINEIIKNSGSQFDPAIVKVFIKIVRIYS